MAKAYPIEPCFGGTRQLASFDTACRVALALAAPTGRVETVPVGAASGRILARPIRAPCALPRFDQAAMDGYAISLGGSTVTMPLLLPVTGRTETGDPPTFLAHQSAHRVRTGAALPDGADTVVMQEEVVRHGDLVRIGHDARPGTHIRRAGEDVRQGAEILPAGRDLRWSDIALLTALGIERVPVTAPVRIGLLPTGSELRGPGEALMPGTIYDSNSPMLSSLLTAPGIEIVSTRSRDDVAALTLSIEALAGSVDLLLTIAGMSVGEKDHVREALVRAGGRLEVDKVAMKPGKPLSLGRIGTTCFVGLPGNPQAAAFCALAFVRPMIAALQGRVPAPRLTAAAAFHGHPRSDRTELVPVRLSITRERLTARRSGQEGSHRLMPMAEADAVAILPGRETPFRAGMLVEAIPFDPLRFGNGS